MKKTMMFLASLLLALPAQLLAQENDNLWLNPGFEADNWKEHWHIPSTIFVTGQDDPHQGSKGATMYVSFGGLISQVGENGLKRFAIEGASSFCFSFWYKGKVKNENLATKVRYYTSNGESAGEVTIPGSSVSVFTEEWQQKEVSIPTTAPNADKTATHIEVFLDVKAYTREKETVSIDDFVLKRGACPPKLQKPEGLRVGEFERELELSWAESGDSEVTWEVQLGDNGTKHETSVPRFIITGLEPNTSYTVKVFAKKGDTRTEATEWQGKTASSFREKDQEDRIPHLRTFSRGQGQIKGRVLHLFYKDLYNANAKFTYWLNGTEVQPKEGYKLEFPSTGKHTLRIRIEESDTEVWVLNYNVQVND